MLITISAGHSTVYPKDPGAVRKGATEAEIAVRMRDKVAKILRSDGLSVLEDGADGVSQPLRKAIELAKRSTIAIEFHMNASRHRTAEGVECLSTRREKKLSQQIAQAIAGVAGSPLRGDGGWKNQNAGNHHRLGFCVAGGIVVEAGFLSNDAEFERLTERMDAVCAAIAEVIKKAVAAKGVSRVVRVNDRGNAVKVIQKRLIELKLLGSADADGWFGKRTKKAVEAFQCLNSLEVDGLVGPDTRAVLLGGKK